MASSRDVNGSSAKSKTLAYDEPWRVDDTSRW